MYYEWSDDIIVIYIKYLPYYGHYSEELRKDSRRFIGRWKVSLFWWLKIPNAMMFKLWFARLLLLLPLSSFAMILSVWTCKREREKDVPSAFILVVPILGRSVPFSVLDLSIYTSFCIAFVFHSFALPISLSLLCAASLTVSFCAPYKYIYTCMRR